MCQPHSLHMPLQIQPCSLYVPRLYSARQHTLYEKAAAETFMLCQGNKKSPLCAQIYTQRHTETETECMWHITVVCPVETSTAQIPVKVSTLKCCHCAQARWQWTSFCSLASLWVRRVGLCLGVRVLGGADGWLVGWLHWQQPLWSSSSSSVAPSSAASSCVVGIKNAINTRTHTHSRDKQQQQQRSGNFMPLCVCVCACLSLCVCLCIYLIPFSDFTFHPFGLRCQRREPTLALTSAAFQFLDRVWLILYAI